VSLNFFLVNVPDLQDSGCFSAGIKQMMGKYVSFVFLYLLALISCSDRKSPNPVSNETFAPENHTGSFVLNITVAHWNPILAKNSAIQAMDSVPDRASFEKDGVCKSSGVRKYLSS
jgi:hypothetical protein